MERAILVDPPHTGPGERLDLDTQQWGCIIPMWLLQQREWSHHYIERDRCFFPIGCGRECDGHVPKRNRGKV